MKLANLYRPYMFFSVVLCITWILGFIVAYLSWYKLAPEIQLVLLLVGMSIPCLTAIIMLYGFSGKFLVEDFWRRFSLRRIEFNFIPLLVLCGPVVIGMATVISILCGLSVRQFELSDEYAVMQGKTFLSICIACIAPLLEEAGWRGYGVDSLRSRFNLFYTSLLFAFLWALWHVPLFFIEGYYHNTLWHTNILWVVNFFVSIIPASFLMNWVYYMNNRSIIAAVILHLSLNLGAILFKTEQCTKCIMTGLLLLMSIIMLIKYKKQFFDKCDSAGFDRGTLC